MSFLSPNQQCWLGDRKDIRPVKTPIPKGSMEELWATEPSLECNILVLANPSPPGKWPLKHRVVAVVMVVVVVVV